MKHVAYRGVCCLALKDSSGRRIWHTTIGRFMIRVSTRRWWKPGKRRSSFYRAKAVEFGPFTFYWRDKRTI